MPVKSFQFVAKVVLMNRQTLVRCFQLYYFLLKRDKKNPSMRFLISSVYIQTYIQLNSERKVQGTDLFFFFVYF